MNEGLIPRRYAKALYKYAQEQQCTQQVYADSQRLEEAFATHPALTKALGNPALSANETEQLLVAAAGIDAGKARHTSEPQCSTFKKYIAKKTT